MRRSQAIKRAHSALDALPKADRVATKGQIAYDVVQAFRRLAPSAIAKLEELINDGATPPALRLKCINLILDRAYGRTPNITAHLAVPKDPTELQRAAEAILVRRGYALEAPQAPEGHIPVPPGGGRGGAEGVPPDKSGGHKAGHKQASTSPSKKADELPEAVILKRKDR